MQPTVLNKVVSLFLVGGIFLVGSCSIAWLHFGPFKLSTHLESLLRVAGSNTLAVVGGLLAISVAAVCGTACESLTDIMIRPLIKRAAKSRRWCGRLRQAGAFSFHQFWLDEFNRIVSAESTYRRLSSNKNAHGMAVGILYASKQSEAIAWAESHYATYVMASNLALLSGILFLYLFVATVSGRCTSGSGIVWMLIALGLFYIFLSLSLDRYLYSYQVAMRQSVMALLQHSNPAGAGESESGQRTPD